jgi:hypothetical protein
VASRPDFAVKPTLTGARVVLRSFSEADMPDYLDLRSPTGPATGECVGEVLLNQWDPGNESWTAVYAAPAPPQDNSNKRGAPALPLPSA